MISILNAFARHSGGLASLLSCIDLFEPGSVAADRLRILIGRVEPDPLLPSDEHATLDNLLSLISCSDAEELYWLSVGEFGPPPKGTGRDLASLARDLSDVVNKGPIPPLLRFLELVATRTVVHRRALHLWIDEHAANWEIETDEIFRHRQSLSAINTEQAKSYLIVELETYGPNPHQYLPYAWFQRAGTSKKLQLMEEPIAIEDLGGVLETLLTRDAEVTRDAASRLVVEVVLPRRLISREVDQLPIAPAGFARPVGTQHAVMVRPSERLHDPALHREWRRKWLWLKQHGGDPRATDIGIHWILRPSEVEPWQLLVQLMGEDTPVCTIMAFPPPEADELGSDEYAAGVHSGAPVMLWCRDPRSAEHFEREIRDVIANHGLHMIPELVHRLRQQAHLPGASPHHIGRHLTLLWDDFDRKPDDFHSLHAPMRGPQ